MKHPEIPSLPYRLFKWFCKETIFEELEGDLDETFIRNKEKYGLKKARRIYTREVFKMLRPSIMKKSTSGPVYRSALLANYTHVAIRNLFKNKLFSTINITGLAFSMAIGLLAITFVSEMYRYDTFHENGDRIYRIYSTRTGMSNKSNDYATTSLLTAEKLRNYDDVEKVVAIENGFYGEIGGEEKLFEFDGLFVDEAFLKVFTFPLLKGNQNTALNNPNSIVLTESFAQKVFSTTDCLNKRMVHNNISYVVTGIAIDPPSTSHITFDALASLAILKTQKEHLFTDWGSMYNSYVYVLLPETSAIDQVNKTLLQMANEENAKVDRFKIALGMESLANIAPGDGKFNPLRSVMPKEIVNRIIVLAIIVLFSACFNYTNLSLARSLKRAKEVGIRKVVGASKTQLFSQFIIESVIVSMISLGIGFLLFLLVKPEFLTLDKYISRTTTLDLTPNVVWMFFGLALVVGLLAGFVPSIIMTKFKPASILKGISKMKLHRGFSLRELMTGLQFTFSMGFAILFILSYKQFNYATNFELGFNTNNILNVPLQNNNPELLQTAFEALPEVHQVSWSSSVPSTGKLYAQYAKLTNTSDSILTYNLNIGPDYLSALAHKIIAGSNFTAGTEEQYMIVNEEFVKTFEFDSPQDAIGNRVSLYNRNRTIIGVVEDFHYGTIFNELKPFAFISGQRDPRYLNLKISSQDMAQTMARLSETWLTVDHTHEFEAVFYEEQIAQAYSQLSSIMKTFGLIAIVAISISLLGLFGMAVYTAESRVKELTIRKVLGASLSNMVVLLSKNFIRVFIIASAIAIPLSYYLFENTVLENMKYTINVGFWELASGSLFIILIAFLTISSQTFKAAKTNPATNLRNE